MDYISGIRKELLNIEDNAENIVGLTESQWVAIRAAHRLLGEYITKEQKPAWSEEDEKHYQGCLNLMRLSLDTRPYPYYNDYLWLKNLKDRVLPQPKQEWSEEDEEMFDFAIRAVGLCKQYAINHQVDGLSKLPDTPKRYEELQDWIKYFKDRYTWKPSDEQMEALDEVYKTHGANNVCRHVLFNLMNDLKKLRKE